jgi:hypothetical protein
MDKTRSSSRCLTHTFLFRANYKERRKKKKKKQRRN